MKTVWEGEGRDGRAYRVGIAHNGTVWTRTLRNVRRADRGFGPWRMVQTPGAVRISQERAADR